MPCLTIVAGDHRAVVAVPATLDGWSNWTVETLLHEQLPARLPLADEEGLLEILCDRAGNHLPHSEPLSLLGLHPGQVLHAVSRDAPFVPVSQDYCEVGGGRSWALQAVNRAIHQSDEILGELDDLRDVASSAASNDGSSTARSERTYDALTGAIERRGEVVNRIDASFDAGLQALNQPSPRDKSRPVSEWPLAPYTALRGSADLPPYNELRYTVDNHTERAPLVCSSHPLRWQICTSSETKRCFGCDLQLPRARGDSSSADGTTATQDRVDESLVSEWRKFPVSMKVAPSQRSAMGGMPLRETDREHSLNSTVSCLLLPFLLVSSLAERS